jgi:hypothetical protein
MSFGEVRLRLRWMDGVVVARKGVARCGMGFRGAIEQVGPSVRGKITSLVNGVNNHVRCM